MIKKAQLLLLATMALSSAANAQVSPVITIEASSQKLSIVSSSLRFVDFTSSIDPTVECLTSITSPSAIVVDAAKFQLACPTYTVHIPFETTVLARVSNGALSVQANLAQLTVDGGNSSVSIGSTKGSLSVDNSNGPVSLAGEFKDITVVNTNGTLTLSNVVAANVALTAINTEAFIYDSFFDFATISGTNAETLVSATKGRFDFRLSNNDLKLLGTKFLQGSTSIVNGVNSDVAVSKIRCEGSGISAQQISSKVTRLLKRRVTRLNGKILIRKRVVKRSKEILTSCADIKINLINGKVR